MTICLSVRLLILFIFREARALNASSQSAREVPSACMYENRGQRIKSLKMVAQTSDKNLFSCLESIHIIDPARLKPARTNPTRA